jgi:hypothetical protein
MCTVTALPRASLARTFSADPLLLRVSCNRDERTTRPAALPPTLWTAGSRSAMMPIDPHSGGTWIAANDTRMVFALLNTHRGAVTDRPGVPAGRELSRGLIIPALVTSATVSDALARVRQLQVGRYQPFRLLLFDRYQLVECWPDAGAMRYRRSYLYGPVMRTSSSLGDDVVIGPRRSLFRRLFANQGDPRAVQDLFHAHQWPGREPISVNMQRTDARTVSNTTIEVGLETVSITYRAIDAAPVVIEVAA